MTIKDQHIVDLLQEHSDLSRDDIERNLSDLKDRIAHMEVDERMELPPLGEFIKTGESLRFVPSVELAAEINFKYAGMQPLEIVEANKKRPHSAATGQASPIEEHSADAKNSVDDHEEITADQPDQPKQPPEEPQKGDAERELDEQQGQDQTKKKAEPAEKNVQKEESPERDKRAGEPEKEKEEEPSLAGKQASPSQREKNNRIEKADTQETKEHEKKPSGTQRRRKVFTAQDKSQKESIFSLLNTIIAIIIIGGIVFLVYKFDNIKERRRANMANQEQTKEQPTSKSEQANPPTDNTGTGNENDATGDDNDQTSAAKTNSNGDASKPSDSINNADTPDDVNSPYGLYGRSDKDLAAKKGYTIVVHSLKNKAAALNRYSVLNETYRAFLLPYTLANGDTSWRVGIGRFQSVKAALSAVDSLKEPYQNNNFIKRITSTQ